MRIAARHMLKGGLRRGCLSALSPLVPDLRGRSSWSDTMKAAILIFSDPKSGGDEALGRLFNGLAAAYDFKQRGDEVTLLFHGAGTRWAMEIIKQDHPANALFLEVQDRVAGASCGCASLFASGDEVEASGFSLIKDNPVPGTTGLPSLRNLMSEGFTILSF